MNGKLIAALNEHTMQRIRVSIHNSSGMLVMMFTHVERCDDKLVFTRARGGKLTLRLLGVSIDCHEIEYDDGTKAIIEVA